MGRPRHGDNDTWCIRLPPMPPFTFLALLPVPAVLALISLSRYFPWDILRGNKRGCGYGDGGGCSRYCELAIRTWGSKVGLRYTRRICVGR